MDHDQSPFPSPYDKKNPQKRKYPIAFRIMTASQRIRTRIGWRELKNDENIDSWMAEAIENGLKADEFTAVVDQLKYFDSLSTESIEVGLISTELKSEFVAAVGNFEKKSDKKDYDPGTDNLVVNLLDPRLYCLVTNVTRVTDFDLDLQNCLQCRNAGEPKERYLELRGHRFPVTEFQLLPAEFYVNDVGQVKITSYINNLHPEFDADLYPLIERVFTCFVPLFNGVLHDLLHDRLNKAPDDSKRQKLDECYTKTYLHGRDIQVIVKLKSIGLSPEKPELNGGDWHIEGVKDEHIVASGIYCFHTENISESRIELRQLRGKNQEMGSLATPENGSIAFPNICQHRSGPFKLEDKSKPGFRKILVFFLIDPTKRIISTRNVPPQQLNWLDEKLLKILPFVRLDAYIVREITSFLDCPYSSKEAIALRNRCIRWRKGERLVFGCD